MQPEWTNNLHYIVSLSVVKINDMGAQSLKAAQENIWQGHLLNEVDGFHVDF